MRDAPASALSSALSSALQGAGGTAAALDSRAHPVLYADSLASRGGPKAGRERVVQLLLEALGAPRAYVQDTATLALYATGRVTGAILDVGAGATRSATVYEGDLDADSVRALPLGGEDLTRRCAALLAAQLGGDGHAAAAGAALAAARGIKERLCRVAVGDRGAQRRRRR